MANDDKPNKGKLRKKLISSVVAGMMATNLFAPAVVAAAEYETTTPSSSYVSQLDTDSPAFVVAFDNMLIPMAADDQGDDEEGGGGGGGGGNGGGGGGGGSSGGRGVSTPTVPKPATKDVPDTATPTTGAPDTGKPVTPSVNNPFTEVQTGQWYYDSVMYVYSKGLMNGTSATEFNPGMPMTRGMIVTVLYRHAGSPNAGGFGNPFSDVPVTWYTDAVKWASNYGIVLGYGDTRYGPDDIITREQLAAIMYRYQQFTNKIPPNVLPAKAFKDSVLISGYAQEPVNTMTMQGVIQGKPNDLFDPQGSATRAEFATMLHLFLTSL